MVLSIANIFWHSVKSEAIMADNKLYYGDNLHILRQYIPDESVDLIYLDPPFNSNQNYNVLFKESTISDA